MPAFEAEVGMPYWIELTTSDPRKSSAFYEEVCGWEVAQQDGGFRMARVQGLPIAGLVPQPDEAPMPDTWVTYFLSAAIESDLDKVENLGGRVLIQPTRVELGYMALAVDPAGGMFGLIEPAAGNNFVAAGEPGTPVWHELTATANFTAALDFYGELFDWEIRTQGEDYATAEADGAAFAGIWNAQGSFPPQVPSFWQTYLGVRDIDAAAATVARMGGEVIREPFDSPFGRMMIVADSTAATVTLVEVEDAPVEEPRESDDLLSLDFEG